LGWGGGRAPRVWALNTRTLLAILALVVLAGAGILYFAPFDREARLRRLDVGALQREARARPNDAEVFLLLGRRLRQAGRLREAFVMTNRAYDLSQGDPRFTAAMVGGLVDGGDYDSALHLAQDAAARWPNSGEVHAQLARVYAGRGRFTDALREAETAVRLAPAHAEAWQALGNACSANKRPDQAFAAFERARKLEPRDSELQTDYGEALAKYGRTADAEAMLSRAVALAPHSARPAGLLGQIQAGHARRAEERAAARALLEKALALAPRATDVQYHLALLDLRDGRADEAIRLLKSCLAEDPGYGEAYLALGQAYRQSGREPAARQAFAAWQRFSDYRREAAHLEMRLRRTPGDVKLLRRLARLHAAYGDLRLAAEYRRRAQALPAHPSPGPAAGKGQMERTP
jgi:tetratricopeptide (TPR) repeat protein